MKKIIEILISIGLSVTTRAAIVTVSNMPSPKAQFNTIQAACDAATSGDSIYVMGSPNAYAHFNINNKKLAVFGPGFSPNKETVATVLVPGCSLTGEGASGSELHGIIFNGEISIGTIGINDLRFVRNRLTTAVRLTPAQHGIFAGYLFEGNWFDNGYIHSNYNYSFSNFLFVNNIFFTSIYYLCNHSGTH
jgi:hypothetical protein